MGEVARELKEEYLCTSGHKRDGDMAELFRRAAIVGLGLIGGSLAMVIRKKRLVKEVVGIDSDETILAKAVHRDVVDQAVAEFEQGLTGADLVVLSTPTHSTPNVLTIAASHLKANAVVCDVSRVKGPILERAAEVVPETNPFVSCHPVVFKEDKGFDEAYPALFKDRPCILTPGGMRNEDAIQQVRQIWEEAGCRVEEMDSEVHDRLFSVLEDLPILLLRLMCKAANQVSGYVEELDHYSSKELKEIQRIVASGSPKVVERFWVNRKSLFHVLSYYRLKLRDLSEVLQQGSLQDLEALL